MSTLRYLISLALALAGVAHAAGTVEVKFVEPEKFSDAGRNTWDRERTLQALTEHLQSLGKTLPDGQALRLTVTDIDLAGELRPSRRGDELRVMRGRADWPSMVLRYELLDAGGTLKSGDARLADMAYQQSGPGKYQGLAYAYEMRMLDRWFKDDIVAAKSARPQN